MPEVVSYVAVLRGIVPAGSAVSFTPKGISTFMMNGLADLIEKRSPSMYSASWIPAPAVTLTVRVGPCPYWTKILATSSDFRPRSMYSPSRDVILMIRVLFSVLLAMISKATAMRGIGSGDGASITRGRFSATQI